MAATRGRGAASLPLFAGQATGPSRHCFPAPGIV